MTKEEAMELLSFFISFHNSWGFQGTDMPDGDDKFITESGEYSFRELLKIAYNLKDNE